MHRLFISDLHLDDPSSPQFLRFDECLAAEARVVDEIYILGDLVEMWIGDDDDGPGDGPGPGPSQAQRLDGQFGGSWLQLLLHQASVTCQSCTMLDR